MKKVLFIALIISFAAVFTGCDLPVKTPYEATEEVIVSPVDQQNDLFESEPSDSQTNPQNSGKDVFVFTTNDKSLIRSTGYTLWCEKYTNTGSDFDSIVCDVQKLSGNSRMGYGLVFCSTTQSESQNYLMTVMINNASQYIVGKVVNGRFKKITSSWKYSSYLFSSTNKNRIEVFFHKDGEHQNKFELKLNGYTVEYFSDSDNPNPVFQNTKQGFVTCIGSQEDFDTSCVNVRFEKHQTSNSN